MKAVPDYERFRQPTVKRLGLEEGWWFFCPHFLNLGLPLLFVDACLLPGAEDLGFESFGTRRPEIPLPSVDLRVELLGDGVSLYSSGRQSHFVAGHWFRKLRLLPLPAHDSSVGILVGDSYALQLTWSTLWRCRIGATVMFRPTPSRPT